MSESEHTKWTQSIDGAKAAEHCLREAANMLSRPTASYIDQLVLAIRCELGHMYNAHPEEFTENLVVQVNIADFNVMCRMYCERFIPVDDPNGRIITKFCGHDIEPHLHIPRGSFRLAVNIKTRLVPPASRDKLLGEKNEQ